MVWVGTLSFAVFVCEALSVVPLVVVMGPGTGIVLVIVECLSLTCLVYVDVAVVPDDGVVVVDETPDGHSELAL